MKDSDESKENPETANSIIPHRKVTGISATLLPFLSDGGVDWESFDNHIERTIQAGLIPAVNMDTGYVNLLDDQTRQEVLNHTRQIAGEKGFVAGAYVADMPGDKWNPDAYKCQLDLILDKGATPVIFQSFSLTNQSGEQIVASYEQIGRFCDKFIAFELGEMFAPFGKIYDIRTYTRIMDIPQCIGAKHSSLSRRMEWQRLRVRDEKRPGFKVFTGNDLAIDMIMYGSDYLLGLSTFAPDAFAARDKLWENGDDKFYELNDLLQYLGFFAFREPVPAYKHSAAQFLNLRGWIESDKTHPKSSVRPESDKPILNDIIKRLTKWL
jgi:dihydrodipicolinate synthase/N-acetylneuraminate lyase